MRREVFFFDSGGAELYGSIYAGAKRSQPLGVLFCNSWGYEGNLASRLIHPISVSVARAGGVAASFHYPGFGDSLGDFEAATIDVLAEVAADAIREASRRYPDARWILAGLMIGASVAVLASDRGTAAEQLLLVQPSLRPARYFARLERASKRSLSGPAPTPSEGFAFGYPLSPLLLESAAAADAAVEAALSAFDGEGAIVRHEEPAEIEGAPERFEQVCVPGRWRYGTRDDPALLSSTSAWLRQSAAVATR
jgi:hypothetical protein